MKITTRSGLLVLVALAGAAVVGGLRADRDPPYDEARAPHPSATPIGVDAVAPPQVGEAVPPLPRGAGSLPLVTLGRSALLVGGLPVTEVPARDVLAGSGLSAVNKQGGPGDLRITPLFEVLEAARVRATADGGTRAGGVRFLVFDDAPYRALAELLATALQVGHDEVLFLANGPAESGLGRAVVWRPAARGQHRRTLDGDTLELSVLLLPEGSVVRTDRGPVGPGCEEGVGLTVPVSPRALPTLRACLEKLVRARPGAGVVRELEAHPATPVALLYEALLAFTQPDLGEHPRLHAPVSPTSVEAWQTSVSEQTRERESQRAMTRAIAELQVKMHLGPPATSATPPGGAPLR